MVKPVMPGPALFAYGTLQDSDILGAALGRPVLPGSLRPATVPDHAAVYYPGRVYPALVTRMGAMASGMLITGLNALDLAVLDAFEGDEYRRSIISVRLGGELVRAETYLPAAPIPPNAPDWTLSVWLRDHKPAVLATETGLASQLRTRLAAQPRDD